jgi:type VI secretion system secreted protein VgrG
MAMQSVLGAQLLSVSVASGDSLDVRQFSVDERVSSLFTVSLVAVSRNENLDFDTVVGQVASFTVRHAAGERTWRGLVSHLQHVGTSGAVEGLSTYQLVLVPTLWLATQRKNYRMFQQLSEPNMVLQMLHEDWGIEADVRLTGTYKKRKYRVQYGESDFAFMRRMLEDAGISFLFEDKDGETKLVLTDAPQSSEPRPPILFRDSPAETGVPFVTDVRIAQQVRPGKYTIRDHDYRLSPKYKLAKSLTMRNVEIEEKLERYQYTPGAFLFEAEKGEGSPVADDRGKARTDEREGETLVRKRLEAKRAAAKLLTFDTSAHDLSPGVVMSLLDHPRSDLSPGKLWLITASQLTGTPSGRWTHTCEAASADAPYRSPLVTPKPKVVGVESATVVGPPGEEIHTDEFGRVRVHFHWDRESKMDDKSSCWIHVSQPWAGGSFGGTSLPRVGQEVLVDFLGGDPDRPVIVGRVYTNLQKTPYKLPENKTQSGWKSESSPGGGGFNELRFEDKKGQELVYIQAEKDLTMLVKHDEQDTVGRDRTRLVKRNESVTVGKNRTKQVVQNERVTIGLNQSISVGVNRSAQIGVIDSTVVGNTHVVMIAPPGEAGPSASSSITMTDKKIVLDTGAGATITMDHDKITIEADDIVEIFGKKRGVNVHASAPGGTANVFSGKEFTVSTEKITLTGTDVKIAGTTLKLNGSSTADLTSAGATTVSGTPVQLNGPGLFAGRVTELAPATITTGAALVVIGGASFPLPVVRLADGSLKIGDHLIVSPGTGRYADFQNRVMRDLGIMGSTPAGVERLNNINNNPGGHDVTIREYSAAEEAQFGKDNSVNSPLGGGANLGYDASGNPVPGAGSGSNIGYNPDIGLGPKGGPNEPGDSVLFHELGHAEHAAYGVDRANESTSPGPLAGYENREEWQTIDGGINKPGGSQIPGVPQSPSENQYLGERNYPLRRTDHGLGYAKPDGTQVTDISGNPVP